MLAYFSKNTIVVQKLSRTRGHSKTSPGPLSDQALQPVHLMMHAVSVPLGSLVGSVVAAAAGCVFCALLKVGGELSRKLAELSCFLIRKACGEAVKSLCSYLGYPDCLSLSELGKEYPADALVRFILGLLYEASFRHLVRKLGNGGGTQDVVY